MSDYLTRLIATSRGNSDVIQPRRRSMFESPNPSTKAAPDDFLVRAVQPQAASQRTAIEPGATVSPILDPLLRPSEARNDFSRSARPVTESLLPETRLTAVDSNSAADSPAQDEPSERPASAKVLPDTWIQPTLQAIQSNDQRTVAKPLAEPVEARAAVAVRASPVQQDVGSTIQPPAASVVRLGQPTAQAALQLPRSTPVAPSPIPNAPESGPTIRVNIGRIEVRAIQPPGVQPQPRAPKHPALSLDEYLRRRTGGGK